MLNSTDRLVPALATGGKPFTLTLPLADEKEGLLTVKRPSQLAPLLVNVEDRTVDVEDDERVSPGFILGSNIANGQRGGRDRVWAVLGGLHKARRTISHMQGGLRNHRKVKMAIGGIPFTLQYAAGMTAAEVEARDQFARMIRRFSTPFSRAWDERNVKAFKRMTDAMKLEDSLGRFNPTVSRNRLWSATYFLTQRQTMDRLIDHRIDARRLVLCLILDSVWKIINKLSVVVAEVMLKMEQGADVARLCEMLRGQARILKCVCVAPYGPGAFRHCVVDLEMAAGALILGNKRVAHDALDRIDRCIEFLRIHQDIEDMLLVASTAKEEGNKLPSNDADSVVAITTELLDFLAHHQLMDRGFKKMIQSDVVAALERARACAKVQNALATYEALIAASKCFGRGAA